MENHLDQFAHSVEQWKIWCNSPLGQLRSSTSHLNISHHLKDAPLHILDVGGGDGVDAIYYASQGHSVTLLDCSQTMLDEARKAAEAQQVLERITLRQAETELIPSLFYDQQFDLILCHLVLEFIVDPMGLLSDICQRIKPGGLLSVIDPNRYSEVYRLAFWVGSMVDAKNAIGTNQYFHPWVNRLTPMFSAEEVIHHLEESGCSLVGNYGISNVFHYLPDERKSDPQALAEIEQLEHSLTGAYPYNLLARYYQVIAQKK